MNTATGKRVARLTRPGGGGPRYVFHPSFNSPHAEKMFGGDAVIWDQQRFQDAYMPDEVTRDHARRMHYAAHRSQHARTAAEADRWKTQYFALRDLIVLGNRKLVYGTIRRRFAYAAQGDDLVGECHLVLIKSVAVYNPWIGIRFSTYACTCLIRALARLCQRMSADWLSKTASLDNHTDIDQTDKLAQFAENDDSSGLRDYLRSDHPLLSEREKTILHRRFFLAEPATVPTLEEVGRDLGLSKERVRQVQAAALGKLRRELSAWQA